MRIAILSDLHLGFSWGSERQEDAFDSFREFMERCIDVDVILIAGDIFDNRNPNTEVFTRAEEILLNRFFVSNPVQLREGIGKEINNPLASVGIPVVAVHGNHERRAKGLLNPVQALEKAGFLIHLHCNGIVFEKEGERVAVQGMSAVPDLYAKTALEQFSPKPVPGAYNIFMLHQILSIFKFPNSIEIEALPRGFDLYVCGDIHESKKSFYDGKPLLMPGSSVVTQLNEDSLKPRGFFIFDTKGGAEFKVFEDQRKVFLKEGDDTESMRKEIKEVLAREHKKKPIIKITSKNIPFSSIREEFHEEALINFTKKKNDDEIEVKSIEEHKLSVNELGRKLLEKNLKEAGLDPKTFESIFELLMEKKQDDAKKLLAQKSKI
jgi:DNA repair exonuclease SbcCD nuclease subunit